MKARIGRVKFFNSVKASFKGGAVTELSFVDVSLTPYKKYSISIDDTLIRVTNTETDETSYTSLHNVVFFTLLE
jgi:hypothetical protein